MFAVRPKLSRLILAAVAALALVAVGCGDSADADNNGATNNGHADGALVSETGAFEAHLTPDPDPPATGANEIHMHLMDADGQAVTGATIAVEPWMPAHGHGSPETPTVEEAENGMYSISNVVYSMPGHWEVRIDVTKDGTSDRIVAEYDVE